MTYNEFIQNIINTRGQWTIPEDGFYENHHIIPVCMGGEPEEYDHDTIHENLIWLTPEEHYDAHELLALENPDNWKILSAWAMMKFPNGSTHRDPEYGIDRETYGYLRRQFALNNPAKQPEVRKIISEKAKVREYKTGWHHTEETKAKIGAGNRGKVVSEETRQKLSDNAKDNPNYGMRGKHISDERKAVLSELKTEYFKDEDNRKKQSESVKQSWEDPEYRRAHSEGMRGKKHTVNKKACPLCGREISTSNFDRHYKVCAEKHKD